VRRRVARALVALAATAGCGKGGGSHVALPLGAYGVSAPLCHSTGKGPAYREAKYRAAFLDFVGLTQRTLTLDAFSATDTFADADCALRLARGVHDNADGIVAFRRNPHWTFTPAGCALAVATDGGGETPVASDYSDIFVDRDDPARDVPYEVHPSDGGGVTLLTIEDEQLSALFKTYGCPDGDRLELRLNAL
jgi:hypothetical protein